ncbi:MAG: hypothetical protein WKG07_46245 [Hymenobacter sp.]
MNLWTVFAETAGRFGGKTAVEIQRSGGGRAIYLSAAVRHGFGVGGVAGG